MNWTVNLIVFSVSLYLSAAKIQEIGISGRCGTAIYSPSRADIRVRPFKKRSGGRHPRLLRDMIQSVSGQGRWREKDCSFRDQKFVSRPFEQNLFFARADIVRIRILADKPCNIDILCLNDFKVHLNKKLIWEHNGTTCFNGPDHPDPDILRITGLDIDLKRQAIITNTTVERCLCDEYFYFYE